MPIPDSYSDRVRFEDGPLPSAAAHQRVLAPGQGMPPPPKHGSAFHIFRPQTSIPGETRPSDPNFLGKKKWLEKMRWLTIRALVSAKRGLPTIRLLATQDPGPLFWGWGAPTLIPLLRPGTRAEAAAGSLPTIRPTPLQVRSAGVSAKSGIGIVGSPNP